MKRLQSLLLSFAAITAFTLIAQTAWGAVIVTGNVALGVNPEGHLNVLDDVISSSNAGGYIGLAYNFGAAAPDWQDATAPGCLCEGWGVSGSGVSGYANISTDGVNNLTVDSFTSDAANITSSVHLTSFADLAVTQHYSVAVAGALFEDRVTITNNSATDTITDVRYVRVMDWDIPPEEFWEFVTIKGTATTTLLEESHDNGFSTANPLGSTSPINSATLNADFTDDGPADHGAYFRFLFGDLAPGESYEFSVFYGAAPSESAALTALGAVGTELYTLGQWNGDPTGGTPATFMFAFEGVGGTPVVDPIPEPATMLLLGTGLVGLAGIRRRKRS